MHAVIVTVAFTDRTAAEGELPGLVSQVSAIPGFVAGYWTALEDERGTAMVVFESREAAGGLAAIAGSSPSTAVRTESIEVGEVMAHA